MSKESQALQRMAPAGAMEIPHDAPTLSLQTITEKIMSGDLTKEKLDMVKELVAMDAERQFAAAFVALQNEMPKVQATNPVPDKHGNIKYHFAAFEDIMRQVQPYLQKHGFSVSFSMRFEQTRVIQTCTLQHKGGHKKSNEFAARVGGGPPGSNESQADGAASTYAKRFALTDALNIVVEKMDNDARAEGGFISPEKADELERRLKMVNGDVKKFLAFADAESFTTIRTGRLDVLEENLEKLERRPR